MFISESIFSLYNILRTKQGCVAGTQISGPRFGSAPGI